MKKKQAEKSTKTENNEHDIDYYFNNNRFKHLLIKTKKYCDLWNSKEALVSLLLSCILTLVLLIVASNSSSWLNFKSNLSNSISKEGIDEVVSLVRTLLLANTGGLFGLLAFVISGLSILSATLSTKVINSINSEGKINYLINIMFSFYYTGGLIGLTLISSLFTYGVTYIPFEMSLTLLGIWSMVLCYISFFTLITSVMLLGTSLRFFLLNYWYYLQENKSE